MQEKTIGTFFIRLTFYFVSLVSVTKYVFATEVDGLAERVCAQGDDLHAGAALQRDMPEEEAPHLSEQLAQTTPYDGATCRPTELRITVSPEVLAASRRVREEKKAHDLFAAQLEQIVPLAASYTPEGNQEDNFSFRCKIHWARFEWQR